MACWKCPSVHDESQWTSLTILGADMLMQLMYVFVYVMNIFSPLCQVYGTCQPLQCSPFVCGSCKNSAWPCRNFWIKFTRTCQMWCNNALSGMQSCCGCTGGQRRFRCINISVKSPWNARAFIVVRFIKIIQEYFVFCETKSLACTQCRSFGGCMKAIFQNIGHMDPCLVRRVADLLAYHLSNAFWQWPWVRWERVLTVSLWSLFRHQPINRPQTASAVFRIVLHTVGPLIIESLWAKKRVSTGALRALDDQPVVQTKIWKRGWVPVGSA